MEEQTILDVGSKVRFEVWGGGYNWLKSNADSSREIQKLIDDVILPHYKNSTPPLPKKVLLVTHSMGGLVVRSLTIDKPDVAWGGVIGAMPANGSMDAYIRARRGTRNLETSTAGWGDKLVGAITERILGNNAEPISRLFSQAPGALELLPFGETYNKDIDKIEVCVEEGGAATMPDRQGKKGVWLHIDPFQGQPFRQLPKVDPYTEIYMCEDWYGLIPQDVRKKYINPETMPEIDGKKFSHEEEEDCDPEMDCDGFPEKTPTYSFSDLIGKVKNFHMKIKNKYPKDSYTLWSGAAGDWLTANECYWQVRPKTRGWLKNWPIFDSDKLKDDKKGTITLGDKEIELFALSSRGDQTVAVGSWWADRKAANVLGHFVIGLGPPALEFSTEEQRSNEARERDGEGMDHQNFYKDPRVEDASIYSAINIIHNHLKDFEQ